MAVAMSRYPMGIPHLKSLLSEGFDHEALNKYHDSLMRHIEAVHEAGEMLGVPSEQLEIHDLSKFSNEEFPIYATHFHGGGCPNPFARAWLHHIHRNEHHWEHYIFPYGYTPKNTQVENGIVEMPSRFVLEMVADWMGASMVYAGTDDMSQWLRGNISRVALHSNAASFCRKTLDKLGYNFIYDLRFRHELES